MQYKHMISSYHTGTLWQQRKQARRFVHQLAFWALALLLLTTLLSANQSANDIAPIILQETPFPFTAKEFYIESIVDEREDRKAVAYLLPPTASGGNSPVAAQPVDLRGGGLQGVRQFIQKGIPRNTRLRPVVLRLQEYKVTEKAGEKGRVKGEAVVSITFELQGNGETIPLTSYKGGVRYDRPASQLNAVEPALRQSLLGSLSYFNTWMEQKAGSDPRLARGIKVIFSDYAPNSAGDTVFYVPDRPLTWDDFTGSPSKPSKFAAAVFPSFSYAGRTEVVDGILHLYLDMKVYVLQSSSWVKGSKDAYGLAHEQRHFDIVKLVAERFKQKIKPEILSVTDYNSIIQYHFIESFREMNKLQEQYDAETQHGLNKQAQEEWNRRITAELGKQ
ncbi:hypothetical protein CLV24_102167 [Pontibacter ummariensis]|uniref:DUF922 domain-containing protein n=2 Tax=Pontibacter ummariensis TaxID=1610492 RepID=A0A239BYB4_9BACT|nr:hypothetical protein CLV24_102167 [Pontibacter ummariensis]SNS12997.1 hypothetical protein SAMN06296052_102245 [Pontibacter ummariensis]